MAETISYDGSVDADDVDESHNRQKTLEAFPDRWSYSVMGFVDDGSSIIIVCGTRHS